MAQTSICTKMGPHVMSPQRPRKAWLWRFLSVLVNPEEPVHLLGVVILLIRHPRSTVASRV